MTLNKIPSYLYKMGKAFIFLEDTTLAEDLAIAVAIVQAFSDREIPKEDLDGSPLSAHDQDAIKYLQSVFDNRTDPNSKLFLPGKARAEEVVVSVRKDLISDLASQFKAAGREDLSDQILEKAVATEPLYTQFGFHVQASVENMRVGSPKNLTIPKSAVSKKSRKKKSKKRRR